jgi:hypothetical protein
MVKGCWQLGPLGPLFQHRVVDEHLVACLGICGQSADHPDLLVKYGSGELLDGERQARELPPFLHRPHVLVALIQVRHAVADCGRVGRRLSLVNGRLGRRLGGLARRGAGSLRIP